MSIYLLLIPLVFPLAALLGLHRKIVPIRYSTSMTSRGSTNGLIVRVRQIPSSAPQTH